MLPGFDDGEEEEGQASVSIDIKRLLYGVWARRKIVAMIATGITLFFASLAFLLLQHSWKAEAALIKREHADQFRIGKFSEPFRQQKYNLKTMLDTLKLPSVLTKTIRTSKIDTTPRKLAKKIEAILGKSSNILRVSVEWEDPKVAADIANNLVDAFIEKNKALRRADARSAFDAYSRQLEEAKKRIKDINDQVLAFQKKNGIISFSDQTNVKLNKLSDIELQYHGVMAEIKALNDTINSIDATLSKTPELIVQSSYYRNPLKKKLGDLEWQLEQARGRYTEKNPKVIDLKERIKKINDLIQKGADKASPENTYAANPIRQELQLRRYKIQDQLRLKQTLAETLRKAIVSEKKKLEMMAAKQKEFFHLSAKQEAARRLLDNLRNRVEEARAIMLRDESDFDIVERATPPDKPESSGRKLITIAGAVLGVGAAVFIALLLELLDPSIRTRRESTGLVETDLVFEFQHVPDGEQDIVDLHDPSEPVATVFRRIVNDMQAQLKDSEWQSLALVSAERKAGRSMLAVNLAQALALKERPAIIIDADLTPNAGDRPVDLFQADQTKPGLLQVLTGKASPREALQPTESRKVRIMSASDEPIQDQNMVLHLGNKRMAALISRLQDYHGYVLYDLPPLMEYETAFESAAVISHALLVLRSGQSKKSDVKLMVERMQAAGIDIPAVIITDVPEELMQTRLQFALRDESSEENATEDLGYNAKA